MPSATPAHTVAAGWPVRLEPNIRPRDGRNIQDNVGPTGEIVAEGDLDRSTLLADDDAAQVSVVLAGEELRRVEAAQRRGPQGWRNTRVLKLIDVDRVVGDAGYRRRHGIGLGETDRVDSAQCLPKRGIVLGVCEKGQARRRNARRAAVLPVSWRNRRWAIFVAELNG